MSLEDCPNYNNCITDLRRDNTKISDQNRELHLALQKAGEYCMDLTLGSGSESCPADAGYDCARNPGYDCLFIATKTKPNRDGMIRCWIMHFMGANND